MTRLEAVQVIQQATSREQVSLARCWELADSLECIGVLPISNKEKVKPNHVGQLIWQIHTGQRR